MGKPHKLQIHRQSDGNFFVVIMPGKRLEIIKSSNGRWTYLFSDCREPRAYFDCPYHAFNAGLAGVSITLRRLLNDVHASANDIESYQDFFTRPRL